MLPVATGHDEAQAWVEAHASARDVLLTHLVAELRSDERFVAAWLIGSFGRNDQLPDALSDINVVAVVAPSYAAALCARPRHTAGQTTPERLALFRRFGSPAVIHENHHNAPPGGTMSYIVYDTGVELAVYLVPQEGAERPLPSRLLFDRVGVPLETAPPPETLEERQAQATASVAFFWMMAGITARYRLRGWDSRVNHFLDMLRAHVDTVRRLVAGEPRRYRRRPLLPLAATPAAQAILIRQLCDEMEALMPAVVQLGGQVPPNPRGAIEQRLANTLQGQSMGEPRLVGALTYIADHLAERFTLADLARASYLSPAHFSAVFRRTTGMAPFQYVQRYRLERAKELLAQEVWSIAQVARAVGLRDPAYFHRVFTRTVGMTPGQYRQRGRC